MTEAIDLRAIRAAENCLDQCRKAVEQLERPYEIQREKKGQVRRLRVNMADWLAAWEQYLVMHARFFTKLEQGSKASDKGRKWYREKKIQRKTDKLLRYLQHARNSDEHTINLSAQADLQRMLPDTEAARSQIKVHDVDPGEFDSHDTLLAQNVSEAPVSLSFPRLTPLPVTDRGVSYDPPSEATGEGSRTALAETIAADGLTIIEAIMEEARSLG